MRLKLGPHCCYSDRSCSAEKRARVCGMCELFNQTRAKVNKTAKLETDEDQREAGGALGTEEALEEKPLANWQDIKCNAKGCDTEKGTVGA